MGLGFMGGNFSDLSAFSFMGAAFLSVLYQVKALGVGLGFMGGNFSDLSARSSMEAAFLLVLYIPGEGTGCGFRVYECEIK